MFVRQLSNEMTSSVAHLGPVQVKFVGYGVRSEMFRVVIMTKSRRQAAAVQNAEHACAYLPGVFTDEVRSCHAAECKGTVTRATRVRWSSTRLGCCRLRTIAGLEMP